MNDTYPRQQARTRRFRLGAPSGFRVSPNGQRIAFVCSETDSDPINRLLVVDVDGADVSDPRVVVDPVALLDSAAEDIPAAELARRERMRETGAGITTFAVDDNAEIASFALSGSVGVAWLVGEPRVRLLDVTGPAIDPRVSPDGAWVAWVADRSLRVARIDGSYERVLAEPESDTQSWGLADFVAAEEFDRIRGFWWSPDSDRLIVECFDEADVNEWFIADPANPAAQPNAVRYPGAGTPNAQVSLWIATLDGTRTRIEWDGNQHEYLVDVSWSGDGAPLVTVLNRAQIHSLVLGVDINLGATTVLAQLSDPCWVEHLPGTPAWTPDGDLITTAVIDGEVSDQLAIDGRLLDLAGFRVRAVLDVNDRGLLLSVNSTPTQARVIQVGWSTRVGADAVEDIIAVGTQVGWNSVVRGGPTLVHINSQFESLETMRSVLRINSDGTTESLGHIDSHAAVPLIKPRQELLAVGERHLQAVIHWPINHELGSAKLPVIMNPYGGPHAQRVVESGRAFAETQWLADQGFCVIVADGRGSPGRGPQWEREVFGDLATAPLEDQIDALTALAQLWPDDIDLSRVGISGWSFGGYLAALAVLKRPDVFHAAVAGAPVTDWALYDTGYTERYLGSPEFMAEDYAANSLLPLAPSLERPLMIIHGMADDNVVVAHSLQLSGALSAAGRAHTFLPLSNVTHMTPQEEVAENLLLLELDFFRRNL